MVNVGLMCQKSSVTFLNSMSLDRARNALNISFWLAWTSVCRSFAPYAARKTIKKMILNKLIIKHFKILRCFGKTNHKMSENLDGWFRLSSYKHFKFVGSFIYGRTNRLKTTWNIYIWGSATWNLWLVALNNKQMGPNISCPMKTMDLDFLVKFVWHIKELKL